VLEVSAATGRGTEKLAQAVMRELERMKEAADPGKAPAPGMDDAGDQPH
jgi:hypothetical protein